MGRGAGRSRVYGMRKNGKNYCIGFTIVVALLLGVGFFSGCLEKEPESSPETGYLEANITICPLCPVEPCDIPEEQKAEIYSARTIQIYAKNREKPVKELSPDPEGHIKTELRTGVYIVEMKPLGIDRTVDLPAEIRISPGETTYLDISIDTGIR